MSSSEQTSVSPGELDHEEIETNGVTLHAVTAGPEDGPLALLLHGFPEFWYGWRRQIGPLAEAGYRVLVPDQRGYNRSEKPSGVAAYSIDELAGDVLGLIEAAGRERAHVIGHDWGAAVAWWLGTHHPERLDRLATINVPHPAVLKRFLFRDLEQTRRSWYMFFFQLPKVPEWVFRRNDYAMGVDALRSGSRPGAFTDEDIERYREAWSRRGAVTAMLNWYRALFRAAPEMSEDVTVEPSTLLIWGVHDTALRRELAPPSIDLCADGRLEFFEDATHWVQHEEPERVNDLLVEFLGE